MKYKMTTKEKMKNINVLKKYKALPRPVKASFWFLITGFLQKGISIITTPIFTRLLSTAEYGQLSIYNSWAGIITIFATLNLSAGVFMRGLIKFEDDRDAYTSSMQGLTTTTVLICSIIYILFHEFWSSVFDLPFILMVSMFINMLVTPSFQFWSSRQRVDFKYKKLVALILFNTIATPVIGVIAVMNTVYKVEARVISTIIINLAAFGVLYFKQAKNGGTFYDKKYWRYALAFNLPLIPHYLSQVVLNQADRLMINSISGPSEAGIYTVAYALSMVMLIVNTSVLNTLNPWIYKKIDSKRYSDISSVSYTILIIIAAANLILIALAPEAISIMAPKEYYAAIWVIPPVASSVFFIFMYSLFASFEFYFEKTKFIMTASILGAILNIGLNYIFINKFGFIAAGYTTLICYIIYVFMHYYFMRKINKDYMDGIKVYSEKIILGISFGFLTISMIFMLLYTNTFLRYLAIVLILTIISFNIDKLSGALKKIGAEKNR